MQKQLFLLLLFSCGAVRCSASSDTAVQSLFSISDESTNVQQLSTVSVTAGAPLSKVAWVCPPCPGESEWDKVINSSGLGSKYLGMQSL